MKRKRALSEDLAPGAASRDGFLGSDMRPAAGIIRADARAVAKAGLTNRQIAARMAHFRQRAEEGLGAFVKVGEHFEASCEVERGFIPCPFGDSPPLRKKTIVVRNLRRNREIVFSELNIHLVSAHGFYEGKGSPFRLEPLELAAMLEIGPQRAGRTK